MSSRTRIPTALEPYLRLPPETALILLTGTLGCGVSWLTTRFVGGFLDQQGARADANENGLGDGRQTSVVLVSFLRDAAFWKNEIRRVTGIDTARLIQNGRFAMLECLHTIADGNPGQVLAEVEKIITDAIVVAAQSGTRNVVLIVDSPDILLALGMAQAQNLSTLLLKLRSQVHSVTISCSSDLPLVSAATSSSDTTVTPIEAESAAFLVQQAHNALYVMSVRELTTGAAKDVSGVLSVTRGGSCYDWSPGEKQSDYGETKAMEALYLVQRDGNVKVFERGSSSI